MRLSGQIDVGGTRFPGCQAELEEKPARSLPGRSLASKAKALIPVFKATYKGWMEDKGPRLGAALSYYTIFSLAPLLLIAIGVAGLIFGEKAAQGAIVQQIQGVVGQQAGSAIQTMIEAGRKPSAGIIASILGAIGLLLGASGMFGEIQDALNGIWRAKRNKTHGIWQFIKARFLSWATVLGTGFLLLVSLLLSAALTGAEKYLANVLPMNGVVLELLDLFVSFVVITLLFAMIFKVLPERRISWSDVWIGAGVTSALFTAGKYLIGLYIGKSVSASVYGAAGSLVLIVAWVYYSAQILYFGAEFTKAYSNAYGSHAGQMASGPGNE